MLGGMRNPTCDSSQVGFDVEARGIELSQDSKLFTSSDDQPGAESGARVLSFPSLDDPDLLKVAQAWPHLPADARAAIVSIATKLQTRKAG